MIGDYSLGGFFFFLRVSHELNKNKPLPPCNLAQFTRPRNEKKKTLSGLLNQYQTSLKLHHVLRRDEAPADFFRLQMITDLGGEAAPATTGVRGRKTSTHILVAKDDNLSGRPTTPGIPPHPQPRRPWPGDDCVYVSLTLHRTLEIGYATLTLYFE